MVYDRIINIYNEQDYFNNNYIPVFTSHFNQPRQQIDVTWISCLFKDELYSCKPKLNIKITNHWLPSKACKVFYAWHL